MSTRLGNGYRTRAGIDLLGLCERARVVFDPIRDRLDAARLAEIATLGIDDANASGSTLPKRPLRAAARAYRTEQEKEDSRYTWHDPHRAALWFGRDRLGGDVAILLVAGTTAYNDAFSSLVDVQPYPYWDGTDRPPDVSAAEWAQRRRFWDSVFPTGRYGDARLQWDLRTGSDDGLDRVANELMGLAAANAPARHDRAVRLVRDALLAATAPRGAAPDALFRHVRHVSRRIEDGHLDDALAAADRLLVQITPALLEGTVTATLDDGQARRAQFAELIRAGASTLAAAEV